MKEFLFVGFTILIASEFGQTLNTKMDFGEEQETSVVTDSSKENKDVEVMHTIVVSTKLKNNNRRGLQNSGDENINNGRTSNIKREDSGEVPIIKGYKAVETTQIFTPDTRVKIPANTVNGFTRHNPLDEYDTYPNLGLNPVQFKPSNYYNNVNWWSQENPRNYNSFRRRNDRQGYLNNPKSNFNRGLSDDGVRDFYCRKCSELNGRPGLRGCEQLRSNLRYNENTTPKLKIDGKLAKLK